ncbi:MAG: class I SAM-dependent DNA methyltransferase [Terriglobales bacterium]
MTAAARSGAAFDAIAAEYDAIFGNSLIGRAQRQVIWEMLDRVFRPDQHILEINCGTGVDALHLAEHGMRVHACDASPAMVDIARKRLYGSDTVQVERRATEDLSEIAGPYDGLFSNFGGLNCLDDIPAVISHLKLLVRRGGSAVLCYMGPFCAWEVLWYLAHRKPTKAFRRWKRSGVTAQLGNGKKFCVRYPTVSEIVRAFGPEFQLIERAGVGVFVPPSYAEGFASAHVSALNAARRADRSVAKWPVFRNVGDHVLLRFEKVLE